VTRLDRIRAHLAKGPATAKQIAAATNDPVGYIRQDMTHLVLYGQAEGCGTAPCRSVIYALTEEGRAAMVTQPWPLIKAALRKAGKTGLTVRDIVAETGLKTEQVTNALNKNKREGHVTVAGYADVGGGKARMVYALSYRQERTIAAEAELPVVPADRVKPALLAHAERLRVEKGWPIVPRKGGVWSVGSVTVPEKDFILLALGSISMVDLVVPAELRGARG
jgi:lambda repressor-like predicted transcriptional regulator